MDIKKVEEYLQKCDELVIVPALNCGLDAECYHKYLQEVTRVLAGTGELFERYSERLSNIRGEVISHFGTKEDARWAFDFYVIFEKQCVFIRELLRLFDGIESLEGIREVVQAQTDFATMQLHDQGRALDIITAWVPPKSLSMSEHMQPKYCTAVQGRDEMLDSLSVSRQRLFHEV